MQTPDPRNTIEKIKAEKDGLDLLPEIAALCKVPWKDIPPADLETRLKWLGVFFRKKTPGYFMMRVRMPNGIVPVIAWRSG